MSSFSFTLEHGGVPFLKGIFHNAGRISSIYHKSGELTGALRILIHQRENDDGEGSTWYISADFDYDDGFPVDYYSAPVDDSYKKIPPSSGWVFVGEVNSDSDSDADAEMTTRVNDSTPPIIYHGLR